MTACSDTLVDLAPARATRTAGGGGVSLEARAATSLEKPRRPGLLESSGVSVAMMERNMEVTAYCNCGKCCCWEHGLLVSPTHYLALSQKTRTLFPIPSLRLKRRRKNPYQDEKQQKTYIFDKYWTATTLRGCVYEGESKQKNQNARIPIPLSLSLSLFLCVSDKYGSSSYFFLRGCCRKNKNRQDGSRGPTQAGEARPSERAVLTVSRPAPPPPAVVCAEHLTRRLSILRSLFPLSQQAAPPCAAGGTRPLVPPRPDRDHRSGPRPVPFRHAHVSTGHKNDPRHQLPHLTSLSLSCDRVLSGAPHRYVPGYGWGEVRDCGSAIKGPHRLDLFFNSHGEALKWGRRQCRVKVVRPNKEWIDRQVLVPGAVKGAVKGVDRAIQCLFGG